MRQKFLTYKDIDNGVILEAYFIDAEYIDGGTRYDSYVSAHVRAKHKTIPMVSYVYPSIPKFIEYLPTIITYMAIGG